VYELDACLTSDDHEDGAAIIELTSGALAYRCHHNSCMGRGWSDVREALGLPHRQADERPQVTPAPKPIPLHGSRGADGRARLVLTRISDVKPEAVKWLVPGLIPLGKITIVDGDPGLGKSTLLVDIAARVSTASVMPNGTIGDLREPANVIILSAEDGAGDTIRPRLEAAEADVERIVVLEAVEERHAAAS